MKRAFIMLVGLIALTSLSVIPQANAQTKAKAAKAPKETSISGMVSQDGKSFVADKDKKSWTVANPDTLQSDAGQHVRIMAQADPATNQVTVKSVKALTAKAKTPKAAKTTSKKKSA